MILSLFLLTLAGIGAGAPAAKPADIAWVASGDFCEPETVLPLPDGTLLVSNVCDFRKAGNGFLTLLSSDGQALDWRIVDGLDAPLGMALSGHRLYLVDNNRLKILNWPGYEPVRTIVLETAVANDVAVMQDGTAYVTDTARNQVLEVKPDGAQAVVGGEGSFAGANGIALHEGYLYIGGGRLWKVDLHDHVVSQAGPAWLSDIDGIEFEADGTLQVTPVGGPLVRIPPDGTAEILAGEGISSANHGYAEVSKLALIPTGFDNTVIAIRIPHGNR